MTRFPLLVLAVVAAAVFAVAVGAAGAQVAAVPAPGLTTDGDGVKGLALGPGNVLYATGGFASLAMRTGHWVRYDASGTRDGGWPDVDGSVEAAVPDGAGGWFIGGEFLHVAGQPRAGLAHVGADGQLDPTWAPAAQNGRLFGNEASVNALCVVGDTVYVGGVFRFIDAKPRHGLAAMDSVTGRLRPWNPQPNGEVGALAAAAGTVYVGGGFTRVGPVSRGGLAAFDAATGALTAWNPGGTRSGGDVGALAVDRGTVYVGGLFTRIAGQRREGIAAIDVATGALTAWNPGEDEFGDVEEIAVAGDTVYAGGSFERMGTARRVSLAAVDAHTGRARPWRADVDFVEGDVGEVTAMALVGDRLYVGGLFDRLAGQRRDGLGVVSAATGAPADWDPRPNGDVWSLVAADDGVLVGGSFSGLDRRMREQLAAVDLGSGALLGFRVPSVPDDAEVDTMAAHGHSVFAGGRFARIGGRRRRSLAKLDARTGTAQRWNAHLGAHAYPNALAAHDGRLYVGGRFGRIGGRPHRFLAALDTRTGRATRWRADADHPVSTIAIHGDTLYVAGQFTRLAGHRRRHVAAIDLRSGRVTAWNPNSDGSVRALAFADGRVYLGGGFRHIGGRRRTHLAAVDLAKGKLQRWKPRANGPVNTIAVIDDTVYAGGVFTSISGVPRDHIAALDGRTGSPTSWNPGGRFVSSVRLLATPAGLVVGGWFTSLGGTSQENLAIFPVTVQPTDAAERTAASSPCPPLRRGG